MAPARKDSTIALCKKVNTQGNTVSIRMLEYLSSSKEPVHGFLALANTFLDLARLVWTIEAGIEESFKTRKTYPVEITSELDARFRHIYDEFIVLSQMVSKFIDNDNGKGGLGKRMRMMFADSEVDKVRMALLKSIESLKMSSAIFRWTLGDDHAEETVAIGYAGLIAALERNNPSKPPSAPPQRGLPQPPSQAQQPAKSEHTRPEPLLPPPNLTSRASHPDIPSNGNTNGHSVHDYNRSSHDQNHSAHDHHSAHDQHHSARDHMQSSRDHLTLSDINLQHEELRMSPDAPFARNEWRASSIQSGGSVQNAMHSNSDRPSEGHAHKHYDEPNYSRMPMREHSSHLNTPEQRFQYNGNMAHRQMDSPIMRSSTMHHPEHRSLGGKEGVIVAVRQGQYRVAEQLLAGGVKMDRIEFASLLHTSIDNKDAATTSILLRFGADADAPDTDGTSPLCAATKAASVDCARILLKHGADANFKDNEGTTALFKAIQAGSVDIMTVLLDNGANPNLPCPKHPLWPSCYHPEALGLMLSRGADHKRTPGIMELAASLKKLESVKILIEAGVSPNVRKDGAYTPLASAIRDNSADIVTYLLDNGADPNLKAVEFPTFKCITHKRTQYLPQLAAAGADLHTPKGIIETAVSHKDKDAIIYLLDQGVNPNDRCPDGGNTALTTAIRDNNLELVDLLLNHGANPAVRGQDWPLCMAVRNPAILERLLAFPGLNPRAFRGVLEMAVHAGHLESVKLLLKAGVSVEDKNCGVFSPLTTAIREGHKAIVRYLLDEAYADPNAPGEHLPLVKALRSYDGSDVEVIQMLLSRGADINRMHRGWNAVLQAVENSDVEILGLLVSLGGPVDLQAVDETGRPVIDIVGDRDWEEGLALLFPKSASPPKTKSPSPRGQP